MRPYREKSPCAAVRILLAILSVSLTFAAPPPKSVKPQRIQSTDPALRISGFAAHQEMAKNSPFAGLNWSHIGPTNVSGRCTDIAVVSPKGKNYTIYVAAASGGVWKTDNEGTTWQPIFDRAPSTAIGDIAIAPSNPDVIWVGTGEANIFRSSQAGIGVFKSTDAGKTWQHLGLADTYTIPRIIVHPQNPDIVYVAAAGHEWTENPARGIFKTVDGGKNWEKILYINEKTGAIDLAMDPSNSDILYAATWQRTRLKWNDPRNFPDYSGSGIYKTIDAGKTWSPIVTGLPEPKSRGRIGIDVCRSKPSVLYAFVDDYELSTQKESAATGEEDAYSRPSSGRIKGATLYRSDDAGETWRLVCPTTPEMTKLMERHSGTYGWVFGQVRVDPNDENTVYIMGVPLSVSHDGGKTFTSWSREMHVDHHGLWIDPDNSHYIVNVNDGGIVISYDGGKAWRQFTNNLPVCQFFDIAYDMANPFRVYGSMQDHGSYRAEVRRKTDRRTGTPAEGYEAMEFEWTPGGEGSRHAIDPTDPNLVYSAGFYGNIQRTDLRLPRRDGTKRLAPRAYPDEPRLRGQWLAPFIISPLANETLFLGMQYVFRSTNHGDTWERLSPDLTYNTAAEMGDIPYHTIFALSESPLHPGLIYAGTDDGKVHVTKDGGKTWTEIMAGLPYQKWVSRIVASAYDVATVYMTQNGKRDDDFSPYIWKSADFGKTWVSIAGNILLGPVNVIREDPVDKNILYVGTDCGVYATKDGGTTWNVVGGNLPMVYVHDLIIHPRDNVLVIATHGRGMWAIDADPINEKSKRRRGMFSDD
jgi:photosystem II stability/assembly factor-like uncharacterized protein